MRGSSSLFAACACIYAALLRFSSFKAAISCSATCSLLSVCFSPSSHALRISSSLLAFCYRYRSVHVKLLILVFLFCFFAGVAAQTCNHCHLQLLANWFPTWEKRQLRHTSRAVGALCGLFSARPRAWGGGVDARDAPMGGWQVRVRAHESSTHACTLQRISWHCIARRVPARA